MSSRRWLLCVVLLSAILHVVGMARTLLPAQDGLKFLRIARQFQTQPWGDAVRNADQHPLYPASIAVAEPVVALVFGHTPNSWRIAAQGVSTLASILLIWPLWSLTSRLFGEAPANLCVLLYALLPFPAEVGHDTLSDALALSFLVAGLCLGERTIRESSWPTGLAAGVMVGLGYLTRPEVALAVPVIVVAAMVRWRPWTSFLPMFGRLTIMSATTLMFVGVYAGVKGEISEKLSMRGSLGVAGSSPAAKRPASQLPKGLDDPKFDFSPKEESGLQSLKGLPFIALKRLGVEWSDAMAVGLVPLVLIGLIWGRGREGSADGRTILVFYFLAFTAIAFRHAVTLGYLSGRHTLGLVVASIPFSAAGAWAWALGFQERWKLNPTLARRLAFGGLAIVVAMGVASQLKVAHMSRVGHRDAGLWLAREVKPDEAVLDTRGWASFVRGVPSYDYWHVKQALSDRHLRYVVVGTDELQARSPRAATLRAVLARAGTPVASFSGRRDGRGSGVEVYRFNPPESWEGITP